MKFNINANIYKKSLQQSPNFVRSNQESLGANSLVININDATKGKNDEIKTQKLNKYGQTKFQMLKMEKLMMTTSVTIPQ